MFELKFAKHSDSRSNSQTWGLYNVFQDVLDRENAVLYPLYRAAGCLLCSSLVRFLSPRLRAICCATSTFSLKLRR